MPMIPFSAVRNMNDRQVVFVATYKPNVFDVKAMLSVVGANATLDQVADEVNERLQRVISSL